jgi:hypothetical protein
VSLIVSHPRRLLISGQQGECRFLKMEWQSPKGCSYSFCVQGCFSIQRKSKQSIHRCSTVCRSPLHMAPVS